MKFTLLIIFVVLVIAMIPLLIFRNRGDDHDCKLDKYGTGHCDHYSHADILENT